MLTRKANHMIATTLVAHTLLLLRQDSLPTVAIVPTVNVSGEKWEDFRRRQATKIDAYLEKEFKAKGFKVIDPLFVQNAVEKLKIDFSDDETPKRSALFQLGKELGADYTYLPILQNTEQKQQDRDLYTDREGRTDVKIWFLNVREEKPILNAKTFIGRSGGLRFTFRPSDRQIQAAENAVRDSLNEAWKIFEPRK
jgi:hypothetical protein